MDHIVHLFEKHGGPKATIERAGDVLAGVSDVGPAFLAQIDITASIMRDVSSTHASD